MRIPLPGKRAQVSGPAGGDLGQDHRQRVEVDPPALPQGETQGALEVKTSMSAWWGGTKGVFLLSAPTPLPKRPLLQKDDGGRGYLYREGTPTRTRGILPPTPYPQPLWVQDCAYSVVSVPGIQTLPKCSR